MASSKSICIDYAGRKIEKRLTQAKNPGALVDDLLKSNNLKIINKTQLKGFIRYKCKSKKTKKLFHLNIFFANFKFDLQRPNWININLGTKIENPFYLSEKDDDSNLTLILGIYVFNEEDKVQDTIFVNCPIKDRNYKKNPSLRARIELIQDARLNSDAIFTNAANDSFRAFKALTFLDVINIDNLGSPSSIFEDQTKFVQVNKNKKSGPPPSSKSYIVIKNKASNEGLVYAAQWGKTKIWKIGHTNNLNRRLQEFNQYIPYFEIPSLDIWTIVISKQFDSAEAAYETEQNILNDSLMKRFCTSGERFECSFIDIQKAFNKHCS